MTNEEARWDRVVAKLAEQTAENSVIWHEVTKANDLESQAVLPAYFAEVAGKHIRVHEYKYEWSSDGETFFPASEVAIEFIDGLQRGLWRFPKVDSRWKLLSAVRYQAANAEDFMKRYLDAS
ncbi:MAG: hypothetical protein KF912_09825 [Phycisphaeraceae bacterium]|nr:hypothetical protein [Phycisphaeraceae bacterium]MBX3367593.1 hypothetical protein [Phycisphaeraceae bacterium]